VILFLIQIAGRRPARGTMPTGRFDQRIADSRTKGRSRTFRCGERFLKVFIAAMTA
jgi:hypothetical protein